MSALPIESDLPFPREIFPFFVLALLCIYAGVFLWILQVGIPLAKASYQLGQRISNTLLAGPSAKLDAFSLNARLYAIEHHPFAAAPGKAERLYQEAEAIWNDPAQPKDISTRAFRAMNALARRHPTVLEVF
jgi:hypothetical protein